jgi:hypothetical protein
MGNGPLRETTHREGKAMRIARLILLALALTFVGSVVVSTGSMALRPTAVILKTTRVAITATATMHFVTGKAFHDI